MQTEREREKQRHRVKETRQEQREREGGGVKPERNRQREGNRGGETNRKVERDAQKERQWQTEDVHIQTGRERKTVADGRRDGETQSEERGRKAEIRNMQIEREKQGNIESEKER